MLMEVKTEQRNEQINKHKIICIYITVFFFQATKQKTQCFHFIDLIFAAHRNRGGEFMVPRLFVNWF